MSDRKIHLILLEELPCPGSHYLHTKKFLEAFSNLGFTYSEIKHESEIISIQEHDIVYISNHGQIRSEAVNKILLRLGERNANYILWFWHDFLDVADAHFGYKYVLTGEHFHRKPILEEHVHRWEVQQKIDNYVPLTFASKLIPDTIGNLPRANKYLAHFVGANYKKAWNNGLRIQFKNIKIVNTPPFISEQEREKIFLSSGVALGWHSDANIQNHVVVERVFEGLSYGNFVVSDTPTAHEITEGIVETASSYYELRDWLKRFKGDQQFRAIKQAQGYKWAKSHGTYTNVAELFLKRLDGS